MSQPFPSRSEHELVSAVRGGSDVAFEELYSRYRERISSYIVGMVRDHALAEDVAQDVFISALRRMRATERPITFKPWIYQIAKNACVDEFRRGRRVHEIPLETNAYAEVGTSGGAVLGSDAAIEGKQRLEDLRGAFRGISDTHHRILVLRELEGRSYQEIGDRMGMSKPVVESTLFRARRRLGEEYQELASGRRCEQTQQLIAAGEERTWRSLRMRQRRQLARHLSHCQPCRRAAREARIDERFFDGRAAIGKIAALLPFPWLRFRRTRHGHQTPRSSPGEQLSALAPLQSLAMYAEQVTPAFAAGRVAVAAAALVIGGGGIVGLTGAPDANRQGGLSPVSLGSSPIGAPLAPMRPSLRPGRPFALSAPAPRRAHQSGGQPAPSSKTSTVAPARGPASSARSGVVGSLVHSVSVGGTVRRVTSQALTRVKVPIVPPGGSGGDGSGGGSESTGQGVNLPQVPNVPGAVVQQGTQGQRPSTTGLEGASPAGKPSAKSSSGPPDTSE